MSTSSLPPDGGCPLCLRIETELREHHLTPKSRGGKDTIMICRDCHSAIHALYTNKELEQRFNTVQALKCSLPFRKAATFISKQDPRKRIKTKRSHDRGKN